MSNHNYNKAGEVFDWVRFRDDVVKWMGRNDCSWSKLYLMAGMEPQTGGGRASSSRFPKGWGPPSLYVACLLSTICDLRLDDYVIDKYEALLASFENKHQGRERV